jgi:hypothetical protein
MTVRIETDGDHRTTGYSREQTLLECMVGCPGSATLLGLPFLTGRPFSNTKDTKVTKEMRQSKAAPFPFVYFAPFVVRLFPPNTGEPAFGLAQTRLFLYACFIQG